jgi:ATP-dependent Clp protease ATP-binding subunit ClpA
VIRVGRRRPKPAPVDLAPIVGELFAPAQAEAIGYRHDFIGTEHVLLALVAREDRTGRVLRELGLDAAGLREEVRQIAGEGPRPEEVFDADALAAIGVDLDSVRALTEATFGAGSLERARGRHGRCGAAGFGVSPLLKQALQLARESAPRGREMTAADVALGLAQQRDSVAAQILDAHGVSPQRLSAALAGGDP